MASFRAFGIANSSRQLPAGLLTGFFGLMLIIGAWSGIFYLTARDHREETGRIRSENAIMARAFEEYARRVMRTADNALLYLKKEYEKNGAVSESMRSFGELTKEDLSAVQVALSDKDGFLVYSAVPLKGPLNISDREHFQVHLKDPDAGLFVGKPLKTQATGTWSFFLSRRLDNPDGSFAGIVSLGLDPFYFGKVYDNIILGDFRSGLIVGTDHIVRVRISPATKMVGDDISGYSPVFREAAQSSVGHYELISAVDNKERMASYRAMPDYPLIVIVSILKGPALANFESRKKVYHTGTLIFSVFVAGFCFFLIRAEIRSKKSSLTVQRELVERKKAEDALRVSEKRFRELARMLPEIVFEMDEAGMVTFVNEQAFKVTDFTKKDIQNGFPAVNFLVPEERERGAKAIKDILGGALSRGLDFTLLGKNGATFPVMIFASPILDEGQASGLRGIIVDVSRLKETEAKLIQAQKMEAVGILTGGIAHDFNNIIQAISGFLNLSLMSGKLDEKNEDWLKKADASCSRAAELVHGLLTFSRKKELRLQSVDMNAEIKNSVAILERTLPQTLGIELSLAEEILCVKADPIQVEHILLNLASNSNDALGGRGKIRISTRSFEIREPVKGWQVEPGRYVRLSVEDDGEGMDEDTIRHIFDPFFTTKEVGKGTGLGLAIVYGLVKEHGGYIECVSKKGVGTAFHLYFPATGECPAFVPSFMKEGTAPSERKPTLLVADDNEGVLETVSEALKNEGMLVFEAASGEEALDLYRQNQGIIDLVVLDVGMPGMGGLQCLKELRRINPSCKVIIATGYALPAVPADDEGRFADSILSKPYRLNELIEEIFKVAGQR
ncbi:response regulator [bacterium]|nr:MAG: response regulator [bacterium]